MASSSSSGAAATTIGGKGSALSSSSLYLLAHSPSAVTIDASALRKLSRSENPSLLSLLPQKVPAFNPKSLSPLESRASLAVLLHKLLLLPESRQISPTLPNLIAQTLALDDTVLETLDFSSPSALLRSIFLLNRTNPEEEGVTGTEIEAVASASAAANGISAILDCCSSVLAKVSDAVAALSCEASGADGGLSGSGFSIKDETDVARDLKQLISRSNRALKGDAGVFGGVPAVHGSFRGAVKGLHSRVGAELNSVAEIENGKEDAFVTSVLPLAMATMSMAKISLNRAGMAVRSIGDEGLRSDAVAVFEEGCPKVGELRERFRAIGEKAAMGEDAIGALHCAYELLVKFREVLAWEAAVALFVLDLEESNLKEKEKKMTLGKGTTITRQILKDWLVGEASSENVAVLSEWAKALSTRFDPKDRGVDELLSKLKEIVESNEVTKNPKLPKVSKC